MTILNRLELPVVCLVSLSLSAVTVCTRLASISTSKYHPHTCTMYMTAPSLHTCCFTSAIPFPSIFTKSPDEIVVEAVDFVEAIVLTARRNTLVISPYCVISLVKIFIFIEWALFHSQSLCYVINIYIIFYRHDSTCHTIKKKKNGSTYMSRSYNGSTSD